MFLYVFSLSLSASTEGRVYYYRAIVAVGNGRGLFGIGIAFGCKPKDARSNAALAAIQNMQLLDLDEARILTTPQHGQEYSAHVKSGLLALLSTTFSLSLFVFASSQYIY